jgi:hypothetical protein
MTQWEFNADENTLTYEFKPDFEVCVCLKTVSRKADIDEAIKFARDLGVKDFDAIIDLKKKLYQYSN